MKFNCARCGKNTDRPAGHVNRSRALGMKLYCGRKCAGLGRRGPPKSKAQKKAEKAAYDVIYRARNRERILAKKREYFQRTYDPEKARIERKKRIPKHVEYCRRPEYKRYKQTYDKNFRAKRDFGPFAEAAMLVIDLNRTIKERATDYEIRSQNGTLNKVLRRRREAQATERSRPRQRRQRRDRDPAVVGA